MKVLRELRPLVRGVFTPRPGARSYSRSRARRRDGRRDTRAELFDPAEEPMPRPSIAACFSAGPPAWASVPCSPVPSASTRVPAGRVRSDDPDHRHEPPNETGQRAVEEAWGDLSSGGRALDAVELAANIIEVDPEDTSVGYGGLPNENGVVQLDASIMDGRTYSAGAVASLEGIKTPPRRAPRDGAHGSRADGRARRPAAGEVVRVRGRRPDDREVPGPLARVAGEPVGQR